MLFGKKGLMKRGALLWAIIVGTIFYAIFGHIDFSSVAQAKLVGLPKIMPYGFGVNVGVVILMLLAYLHSVSEALGMYSLIAGWDGQQVDEHRANGVYSDLQSAILSVHLSVDVRQQHILKM